MGNRPFSTSRNGANTFLFASTHPPPHPSPFPCPHPESPLGSHSGCAPRLGRVSLFPRPICLILFVAWIHGYQDNVNARIRNQDKRERQELRRAPVSNSSVRMNQSISLRSVFKRVLADKFHRFFRLFWYNAKRARISWPRIKTKWPRDDLRVYNDL